MTRKSTTELAPDRCVVCSKARPTTDTQQTWTYIANSVPIGAMACSEDCLKVALRRYAETGRVDQPRRATGHDP